MSETIKEGMNHTMNLFPIPVRMINLPAKYPTAVSYTNLTMPTICRV